MCEQQDTDSRGAILATIGLVRGTATERFAVTYLKGGTTHPRIRCDESITFSLADWTGSIEPRKEQVVELYGVQLFVKGWRASKASPIRLEPQEIRKERI